MVANTLTTQFNSAPWFDDYDPQKKFVRWLFKPGFAVQARELTQLQTGAQHQISSFAANIFKDGSIVTGCQFIFDNRYHYIKLRDLNSVSAAVDVTNFTNTFIQGQLTDIKAAVIGYATGSQVAANTKTLFIKYLSSGSDPDDVVFGAGEQVVANNGFTANIISSNTSVGTGYSFTIKKGVVYAKGFFVDVDEQTIVLERYNTEPSYRVGLDIVETIVDANDDVTLRDPAQGSYNFAAPGADRLKLDAILTKYSPTANTGTNFMELFTIVDGVLQTKQDKSQYNVINDSIAKGRFDQAGDYFVSGMNVVVREHLDNGTNQGYLTANTGGDSTLLAVGIEPGVAYIKGYEINNLVTKYTTVTKGTDYKESEGQVFETTMGAYVFARELVGNWSINSGQVVDLYNTAQKRLSSKKWTTGSQTGSKIGSARFKAIKYYSGTIGDYNCVYQIYLYDIQMTGGPFSSVRNIYVSSTLGADLVLSGGNAVLQETNINSGVYAIPSVAIRSIRDANNSIETSYSFAKTYTVSIGTGGTFSLTTGVSDEIFPYTVGALSNSQKRGFLVSLASSANVSMSGTITTTSGSNTFTGSGTSFNTKLNVGDKIQVASLTGTHIVTAVTNSTSIHVLNNAASSVSGQAFYKTYYPGDLVDFTIDGGTGNARTVTAASSTTLNFDMKETLSAVTTAYVTTSLVKSEAREIAKTLRKNRYVQISCATSGTTGPFNLGVSDVFKIVSVRKRSVPFVTSSDGTDVTSSFTLDNGQRDNHYDHARIISNGSTSLTGTDYLLVKFDYFYHDFSQGVGYFSVDSYPVDDVNGYANTIGMYTYQIPRFTSPTTGVVYDLRNSIDTRPSKILVATDSTTVSGASTSPATTNTFNIPSGGLHLPSPDENFNYDYTYYLPRKDLVVLSKDGNIRVIKGAPALAPITPNTPDDGMSLATLTIAPYPSLAPFVATNVGRLDEGCKIQKTGYKRFTMREIGVLQQRIDSLEEYAALSQLEQSAVNLKIVDTDGLDRFKNGIFTDSFKNHALANINDASYLIATDAEEHAIRPIFDISKTNLEYSTGSNIINSNNLIYLSYTETEIASQPYATDTRNAAGLYYDFKGTLLISPPSDNWVDTQVLPALQVFSTDEVSFATGQLAIDVGPATTRQTRIDGSAIDSDAYRSTWNSWGTFWLGKGIHRIYARDNLALFDKLTGGGHFAALDMDAYVDIDVSGGVVASSSTSSQSLGERVVSTSVIPYIRPQWLYCSVTGMKASTKLYTFFDGENMSSYVIPTNSAFSFTGSMGSNLITDASGTARFIIVLPSDGSKRFRTGDRVVKLTDSLTNNDATATTSAQAIFSASGLLVVKQETILTTTRTEFRDDLTVTVVGGYDPLAQTFQVKLDSDAPGYFVSSIDLYFAGKDPNYGVYVQLRAVDNSGNVTKTVLPYSQVEVPSSHINVNDTNGTTPTRIYFKAPVYLENNAEYAFVVIPVNNNPNTTLWTATLGSVDIATGVRITQQPYSGVLFVSSNNNTWSPIQTEDLKFKLYRAVFSTSGGSVVLANESIENFKLNNIERNFTQYGETIAGDIRLTFSSVLGGAIANTYTVVGGTSGTTGSIMKVSGSSYYVRDPVPVTRIKQFIVGESATFKYANGTTVSGLSATIASQTIPSGTLYKFSNMSANNYLLQLAGSSGKYEVGEKIRGNFSNTWGIVSEINDYKYSTLSVQSSFVSVTGTSVAWSAKTTSNTYSLDSDYSSITINENNNFSSERLIASRSHEVGSLSSAKSLQVRAILSTSSNFVSPMIDLNKSYALAIHNVVNNTSANETNAAGGSAINKYISQTITLDDGQDAEDLNVFLSCYRPSSTDILVYAKVLNGEDSDLFSNRPWIQLSMTSRDVFCDIANTNDIKDYSWSFPDSIMTGTNGEIQYTSSGVTYTGYKYFAIKIVLLAQNSAVVPRARQLRAIALQI